MSGAVTYSRLRLLVVGLGAAGVHVVAATLVVLPAASATRGMAALVGALPMVRQALLLLTLGAAAAVIVMAVRRPTRPWPQALTALFLAALGGTGMLYGCAATTRVDRRPVAVAEAGGVKVFDHGQLDRVLATFVDEHGMVDYPRLEQQRGALDDYVGQLATASPRSRPELFPTEEDRMAYWINAYNALMLRAVVDHYPVGSVKDIMVAHGVFSRLYFPVGGVDMTLDDIEKGILLKEFHDPRVHFALTCASMSCPRLDREAFHAQGLSERLDREGRSFLNSSDGLQLDIANRVLRLSKYFDWYGDGFGAPAAFVKPYLTPERRAQLAALQDPRIEFLPYDWRLNDQAAPWRAR